MTESVVYDVVTDMDPQMLTAVSLEIFRMWVDFAMGKSAIGGKSLMHPTGRYASSITINRISETQIAIMSDDDMAPEGHYLEVGHKEVDLKKIMQPGKAVPMHRGAKGAYGSKGYGKAVLNRTPAGRASNIWAKPKARGSTGFARIPTKITADNMNSWIIPAMPAYSPAEQLAALIRQKASRGA